MEKEKTELQAAAKFKKVEANISSLFGQNIPSKMADMVLLDNVKVGE